MQVAEVLGNCKEQLMQTFIVGLTVFFFDPKFGGGPWLPSPCPSPLVESHAERKSVAISSPAAYLYGTGSTIPAGLFWGGSQLLCCSQYTRFDKFSFIHQRERKKCHLMGETKFSERHTHHSCPSHNGFYEF